MSLTGISELKASYARLGPARFTAIMLGIVAWIAVGVWLSLSLHWPDHYGFHCHGRGCWAVEIWHSPRLIGHGHHGPREIGLFLWIWSMPAAILGALGWGLLRKRPRLSLFEPRPAEPPARDPPEDRP